jgi:xylitol oxidase
VLPVIEKRLAPYNVRPHWGKLFTLSPKVLQSRYEKLSDFKALLSEYDSEGKFRNDFLQEHLYS